MSGSGAAVPERGDALVILAGGGRFPVLVAEAARRQGRDVTIAAIRGEADEAITQFPHRWIGRGQLGTLMKLMRAEGARDLVIVGGIKARRLPRLSELDLGGILEVIRHWRILRHGDDGLLRKIARLFEMRGLRVVGAAEVAPELLMPKGALGHLMPTATDLVDMSIGLSGARAHGREDRGQAVIVRHGVVVLKEGPEGTDAMIASFGVMRAAGSVDGGILIKCPKPRQDRRLDMPAIGPETVRSATAAGLRGIAVEAGGTIVADREEMVRLADAAGIFVWGMDVTGEPSGAERAT